MSPKSDYSKESPESVLNHSNWLKADTGTTPSWFPSSDLHLDTLKPFPQNIQLLEYEGAGAFDS